VVVVVFFMEGERECLEAQRGENKGKSSQMRENRGKDIFKWRCMLGF